MTRRLLFSCLLAATASCDDGDRERRRLENDLGTLVRERGNLAAHQMNLRLAADAELAGRPVAALPADSQTRITSLQQQYELAARQLREVDMQIEATRYELAATP